MEGQTPPRCRGGEWTGYIESPESTRSEGGWPISRAVTAVDHRGVRSRARGWRGGRLKNVHFVITGLDRELVERYSQQLTGWGTNGLG